jgi:acyl phosphate:glycerol-3-phosphate acyltransferase
MLIVLLAFFLAYLIGSVPYGYLIGRLKGVNLLEVGSKNIGATNAGRVLGKPYAVIVFALDFLKGALPTIGVVAALGAISPGFMESVDSPEWLRVAAAAGALLGHMLPLFLGFRGGKGVATGAGVVAVLTPIPMLIALGVWGIAALGTKYVSVASIASAITLLVARMILTPDPFHYDANIVTFFIALGVVIVIVKHRSNLQRLRDGTENRIGFGRWQPRTVSMLHFLAAGFAFGGGFFFNFLAAPAIFASFTRVVAEAPSDRTAMQPIGSPDGDKAAMASALAGSAVGPIFPRHFFAQIGCAIVILFTVRGKWGVLMASLLLILAVVGWPISQEVSRLRIERYTIESARAAFGQLHLVSLGMSALSSILSGVLVARAGWYSTSATPVAAG